MISFVVYPAMFLAALSVYRWRDDRWELSRAAVIMFVISQLFLVGFCAVGA